MASSIYAAISASDNTVNSDNGWQTVTYAKRQRKNAVATKQQPDQLKSGANVFKSVEEKADERRRRRDAEAMTNSVANVTDRESGDEDGSGDEERKHKENVEFVKKVKVKKEKKPKVSVVEAAAKIDAEDLSAFLVDVTASFENQDDIQLKRLADYFGRAFSGVNSAQFPWVKMFRESLLSKIVDTPVSYVSEPVYKTAVDWINKRNVEALASFALWSLDSILADFAAHQPPPKGSKKPAPQPSNKSQVKSVVISLFLVGFAYVWTHVLSAMRELVL